MATKKKSSKLGIGIAVGTAAVAAAGAAAAFLLTTKKGKKLRKDFGKKTKEIRKKINEVDVDGAVRDIFGEVTDQGKAIYENAQEGLAQRLAHLKEAVGDIDYKKYQKAVDEVVTTAKKRLKTESKNADKLKKDLLSRWNKLGAGKKVPAAKKAVKKIVKKATSKKKGKK